MSFLSSFKSKSNSKQSSKTYKLSEIFKYMQQKGWYTVTATIAMELYNKNSALSDAVDTISSECKSISPVVIRNEEIVKDHPVLKLLERPNPKTDWNDFMESLVVDKILTRNSFITAFGNVKFMPIELWNTPCASMYAQGSGLNYTLHTRNVNALVFLDNSYKYDTKSGRYIDKMDLAELIKMSGFMNYTTSNGYIADSPLSSIIYELEILNNGNNHNLNLLLNGVNLSGVFNIDTIDKDSVDQFKLDVQNYFGGSGNAGKYLVSKGKTIDFKPIQMSNKEMQQIENINIARRVIYDRLQIPSPLRDDSVQTYDNYNAAQYVFYDRTILPIVKDVFSDLTMFFRRRKALKDNETIGYNPTAITALQTRFNEELKLKNELGVFTINEIRAMRGEEGIGKEGDVLYQEFNLVPVGFRPNPDGLNQQAGKKLRSVLEKKGYSDSEIEGLTRKFYADSE